MNFLRYFGCSNICFLEFLISPANFRLTWRIVAPTRQKIARKLGDISKRIERDIRSHYFCKLPHTNTSTTSFFGWTRSTSCAFLRLAVTLVTSCGFLRLDFQLLALRMFLRVNRKNIALSLLPPACVFLRRKNFLRHFLRVHYFWVVLYKSAECYLRVFFSFNLQYLRYQRRRVVKFRDFCICLAKRMRN